MVAPSAMPAPQEDHAPAINGATHSSAAAMERHEASGVLNRDTPSAPITSILGFTPEINDLAHLVRVEIAKLKAVNRDNPDESRVKDLVALTRLLQTLCDLASDARRAEQEKDGGGTDILEFRKQLEEKIAALAGERPHSAISQPADA